MSDRPIAKYENGKFFQDIAGTYREVTPRDLWWAQFLLQSISATDHATRIQQITEALEAYEADDRQS